MGASSSAAADSWSAPSVCASARSALSDSWHVADCGKDDACAIRGQQPIPANTHQPNGLASNPLNPHSWNWNWNTDRRRTHRGRPLSDAWVPPWRRRGSSLRRSSDLTFRDTTSRRPSLVELDTGRSLVQRACGRRMVGRVSGPREAASSHRSGNQLLRGSLRVTIWGSLERSPWSSVWC